MIKKSQLFEKVLTTAEARELLTNISKPSFRKLIREGKIRHHKYGRRYFFIESEFLTDLKNL